MARTRKRAGVESYRAYVDALKAATSARKFECGPVRPAAVFAATCTGTSRLSREIGLPLACVGVAADPRATVEAMSRDSYGAWLPYLGRTPFGFEEGWADWTLMHLGPDMAGAVSLGLGVELRRGVVTLDLGPRASLADFRRRLTLLMAHRRMHEVASRGDVARSRVESGGPLLVTPRYTSVHARVDDLLAFDPWQDLGMLGSLVEAALAGAVAQFHPHDDQTYPPWPGRRSGDSRNASPSRDR